MYEFQTAVVGAGFIGPVHVEGLRRAGVRVAGILGADEKESALAATRLGLPKAYRSYEEILEDASVDSVHIAVPNVFHFAMARDALGAGKHVMCEKPLAMTSQESGELVELAAARESQAAAVNYNVRFYPLCIEARERVRAGEVGELFHVGGCYVQDWLQRPTDYNWRVLSRDGGSLRAVADIGTHWLDLVLHVSGQEVEAVLADLHTVHPVRQRPTGEVETFSGKGAAPVSTEPVAIETEDYGAILLRFTGGARGVVWVSQVTAGRKNCLRFELAGSERALSWSSERPNELWVGERDEPNRVLIRDPALMGTAARAHADYPGGHNEGFPDTFKQCFRSFYGYIEAGDFSAPPPFPTFADGHREIILCEAIERSHREERWVHLKGGEA